MEERDRDRDAGRGGQGSFGGQAPDDDDGNRGMTESGNFRNDGAHGRDFGPTYGRSSADDYQGPSNGDRYGDNGCQGAGSRPQPAQSAQLVGVSYRRSLRSLRWLPKRSV